MKREIIVSTRITGLHYWAEAPEEVEFLRFPHRHVFHVKVGIPVLHNDREREFFIEQGKLEAALSDHWSNNPDNVGSCEMICEAILNTLTHVRWVQVEEDGENGARIDR